MKKLLILAALFLTITAVAQDTVKGKVVSTANEEPLIDVNIVNLNQVKGGITNQNGEFEIAAEVDDTLFFSYLGHKSISVRVTQDWKSFGDVTIKMTEVGFALEEVILTPMKLTGYLEIDAKNIPIYTDYRYSISGLASSYEAGNRRPGAIASVLGAIFNPADFLYNLFGSKPRELRKLRKMREDDAIRNLLQTKYDRETLLQLLQLERLDLDEMLRHCNYSAEFIQRANDLQILDAISDCYEEYKVLKNAN